MKNQFMAAAAVAAIMTATGAAHAQTADVTTLKQEAAALKKQNEALEKRLNKLEKQQAAQAQVPVAGAAAPDFLAQAAAAPASLLTGEGPLTWKGITIFGTIDAGLGWASSGLPINGKYYQGAEVVNKYAHSSYFGIVPNGLSNSTIGIKGSEELIAGWSGVFNASTYFNPQSGQLQNAPGSIVDQQGLNRNNYSNFGDGSRGGQAFNDQLYVGVSNKTFGQLTFGRHTPFANDLIAAYDPAKSNAFSIYSNSGTYVGGLGNSANARWDDSFKYRVEYGPVRFGAIYKFADGNSGSNVGLGGAVTTNTLPGLTTQNFSAQNDAGQIALGGSYAGLDVDGVLGYFHQAISSSTPLSAAQLGGTSTFTSNQFTVANGNQVTTSTGNANSGTLSSTASDITGGAVAAKYTWNEFKFYAGWAHEIYHNPANNVGIGAQANQGGYIISSINNGSYPNAKILDNFWVGAKYAYDAKTDFTVAYYHTWQNGYGWGVNTPGVSNTASTSLATCSLPAYLTQATTIVTFGGAKTAFGAQTAPRSSTCSGALNGVSGYVDYHFTPRFDIYGGILYSVVTGGLASNYYNPNNWAPTAGVRYSF
jgi:predicted porin